MGLPISLFQKFKSLCVQMTEEAGKILQEKYFLQVKFDVLYNS